MKKYNIIYADPAWSFQLYKLNKKNSDCRAAEKHYDCMSIDDICNLPIKDICAKDCVLFLWVRNPMLKEGIKVLESWGFTFKTVAFTWVKKNKKSDSLFWGLGYWTRQNTEMCLLGTIGKPKRFSKAVHSVLQSKIEQHSKKPNETRDRIVKLCGDLPRIELFARQKTYGWDSAGFEVDGLDINKSILLLK